MSHQGETTPWFSSHAFTTKNLHSHQSTLLKYEGKEKLSNISQDCVGTGRDNKNRPVPWPWDETAYSFILFVGYPTDPMGGQGRSSRGT